MMKTSFYRVLSTISRQCKFVHRLQPFSSNRDRYHVPYKLSIAQRLFSVPYYGLGAIADPERGDLVAGLGDVTGGRQLERIRVRLMATTSGRQLLEEKPLITNERIGFASLHELPDGSMGKLYAEYMNTHSFNADERTIVKNIMCPDTAYVMARHRQIHDFWHVLSDLPPTILGEVALKWFEWKLTGLPVGGFSSLLGPLKLPPNEVRLLVRVYLPWVRRSTCRCEDLLSFRYEQNLHRPVEEIRRELGMEQAPPLK
jgi:ubiquinone biosynthesis protein COQ4